jgi:hypothetical protein
MSNHETWRVAVTQVIYQRLRVLKQTTNESSSLLMHHNSLPKGEQLYPSQRYESVKTLISLNSLKG